MKRTFAFPLAPRTGHPTRVSRSLKTAEFCCALTAPPNAFSRALSAACPLSLGRSHRSCKYSDPADSSGLLAGPLERCWAASGHLQGAPGQWPDASPGAAAQLLQRLAVVGRAAHVSVQAEAVAIGAQRGKGRLKTPSPRAVEATPRTDPRPLNASRRQRAQAPHRHHAGLPHHLALRPARHLRQMAGTANGGRSRGPTPW